MPQMVHAGSFRTLLCDHVKLRAQSNMMKLKEIARELRKVMSENLIAAHIHPVKLLLTG